ncbi:hypothetical protein ACFQWB_01650 [Paenibacillus thermoaerophilus]|uniref:N-terminal domain of peptidoglycan hydrolase CwlO-containing protein n=1 Tax=Paenibacillus thermoaerophilus TaxID=1215385 RepID=A0ABW2UZI5_9BACL|nr:hypothetical protein [Paenibacillus thermoaerophilus]TMV19057.1 hypothetical protein FE781_00670 [Paenibacillus thermoaerophilus]
MRRWWIVLLAAAVALTAASGAGLAETGSSEGSEFKDILQKALSVKQIDEELVRLKEREDSMKIRISELETETVRQEQWAAETRKRAGRVIRSYYTGERQSLWLLLLSSKSLAQAVDLAIYLDRIISRDQMLLKQSVDAQKQLMALRNELNGQLAESARIRDTLLRERERQVELEASIAAALAEAEGEEAEALKQQIETLGMQWTEVGKPKFRTYFEGLKSALTLENLMPRLGQTLNFDAKKVSFSIRDTVINELLREKNPLFEDFSFALKKGYMEGSGTNEGVFLSIRGQFAATEEGLIRFKIEQLHFNEYALDESTIRALEEEFDLSFDPAELPGFKRNGGVTVRHEDQQLYIEMMF